MVSKDKTYLDGKIEAFERCLEAIDKLQPTKESNFELYYVRELIRINLAAYKAIKEKSKKQTEPENFSDADNYSEA